MWVFDGEEWTEEGASASREQTAMMPPYYADLTPELQVQEIVPTVERNPWPLRMPSSITRVPSIDPKKPPTAAN